jgi:branched-subunit amino acid transport protein
MTLSYKYGGINLHEFWFVGVPRNAFNFIAPKFVDPVPASISGWGFTALGAVLMGLLTYIRYHFVWWPIHPLGFATGTFNIMNWVWFSIFTAWVLKIVILKYGGSAGYVKTRPFFLGLILGQVVVAGLWLVIDACTGKTGNVLGYF